MEKNLIETTLIERFNLFLKHHDGPANVSRISGISMATLSRHSKGHSAILTLVHVGYLMKKMNFNVVWYLWGEGDMHIHTLQLTEEMVVPSSELNKLSAVVDLIKSIQHSSGTYNYNNHDRLKSK